MKPDDTHDPVQAPRAPEQDQSYMAFISYSHRDNLEPDRQWANWLHQRLEQYDIPPDLVGQLNQNGGRIPARIYPVFRDETSLPAHHSLSESIRNALDNSRFLLVLCSPDAQKSSYVAEEIRYFKHIGKSECIIAAILEGKLPECLPYALQYHLNAAGEPDMNAPADPIVADFRLPNRQRGYPTPHIHRQVLKQQGMTRPQVNELAARYDAQLENSLNKIIAALLEIMPETLLNRRERHQQQKQQAEARKTRQRRIILTCLTMLALISGIVAVIGSRIASEQSNIATIQTQRSQDLASQVGQKAEKLFGDGLDIPPFLRAITETDWQTLESSVDHGVDVNMRWDHYYSTPLIVAIASDQLEIARWLLQAGADINQPGEYGYPPMHHAAMAGRVDFIHLLYQAGADVNAQGNHMTALEAAAADNKANAVRALATLGATLAWEVDYGMGKTTQSALINAAPAIIPVLLDLGANPDLRIFDNANIPTNYATPRLISAENGDFQRLDYFFEYDARTKRPLSQKNLDALLSGLTSSITATTRKSDTWLDNNSGQVLNYARRLIDMGASPYSTRFLGKPAMEALIHVDRRLLADKQSSEWKQLTPRYQDYVSQTIRQLLTLYLQQPGFTVWATSSDGTDSLSVCSSYCSNTLKQVLQEHGIDISDY